MTAENISTKDIKALTALVLRTDPTVPKEKIGEEVEKENLIKLLTDTLFQLLSMMTELENFTQKGQKDQMDIGSKQMKVSEKAMLDQLKKIEEYEVAKRKQEEEEARSGPFKIFVKVFTAIMGALLSVFTGPIGLAIFVAAYVMTSPDIGKLCTGEEQSLLGSLADQVTDDALGKAFFKVAVILALSVGASAATAAKGVSTAATQASNSAIKNLATNMTFNLTTAMVAMQTFVTLNPTVDFAKAHSDDEETKKIGQIMHMCISAILAVLLMVKGPSLSTGQAALQAGEKLPKIMQGLQALSTIFTVSNGIVDIKHGVLELEMADKKYEMDMSQSPMSRIQNIIKTLQDMREALSETSEEFKKDLEKIINDFVRLAEIWKAESDGLTK